MNMIDKLNDIGIRYAALYYRADLAARHQLSELACRTEKASHFPRYDAKRQPLNLDSKQKIFLL